jgi:hypothetical protein
VYTVFSAAANKSSKQEYEYEYSGVSQDGKQWILEHPP